MNTTVKAKKWVVGLVSYMLICLLICSGCSTATDKADPSQPSQADQEAINAALVKEMQPAVDQVLAEFMKMTEYPRQSKHEQAISDYLLEWAKSKGLTVVQDQANNIIIEKKPSSGYENAPIAILQGHMDMVCIGAEGVVYDPLTDPIKVNNDGKIMTAQGTSLGADDGIGVGMILYILGDENLKHGPLRAIITTDEENGMSGAKGLDPKYLDATYLINLDNEDYGSLCNSSADTTTFEFKHTSTMVKPAGTLAYEIKLNGLLGGHSGVDINKGRANAIKEFGVVLEYLIQSGMPIELANINGGVAANAIPSATIATVVIPATEKNKFEEVFNKAIELFANTFGYVEKEYQFNYKEVALPEKVFSKEDTHKIFDFLAIIPNGINTISQVVPGLIESSVNVGTISTQDNLIKAIVFSRSSEQAYSYGFRTSFKAIAELSQFSMEILGSDPGWAVNPNSKLVPLTTKTFLESTGTEMTVDPVHGGLECGWFATKNPKLDIISLGPTLENVHTPKETLYLDTIHGTLKTVIEVLAKIK